MTILAPREISADDIGMCVQRVRVPVTPLEIQLAATLVNDRAIYRVTLWAQGRVFFKSTTASDGSFTISGMVEDLNAFPLHWAELVRPAKTTP